MPEYGTLVSKAIRRLGLYVEARPALPRVLPYAVPVFDLDSLALENRTDRSSISVTGTGYTLSHRVPAFERWLVQAIFMEIVAPSVYTGRLECNRFADGTHGSQHQTPLILAEVSDAGAEQLFIPQSPFVLFPWDELGIVCSAHTTLGNVSMNVMYLREECAS